MVLLRSLSMRSYRGGMARTPRVKLVPPRLPASHVRRPQLETLLLEAENRRLASVAAERGWAWYLVDAADRSVVSFARGLADALEVPFDDAAFAGAGGKAGAEALATS